MKNLHNPGWTPYLQASIASKQLRTLEALPEAVSNPMATLLQYYLDEGIPANKGSP